MHGSLSRAWHDLGGGDHGRPSAGLAHSYWTSQGLPLPSEIPHAHFLPLGFPTSIWSPPYPTLSQSHTCLSRISRAQEVGVEKAAPLLGHMAELRGRNSFSSAFLAMFCSPRTSSTSFMLALVTLEKLRRNPAGFAFLTTFSSHSASNGSFTLVLLALGEQSTAKKAKPTGFLLLNCAMCPNNRVAFPTLTFWVLGIFKR